MRKEVFILFITVLSYSAKANSECPAKDVLLKRLTFLKSSKISPRDQLAELLTVAESMKTCVYRNDSTHVTLLRTIANLYFQQEDYVKAVQFRQEAIDIITANASSPAVKLNTLPGGYFWLAVAYDSLHNFSEKMRAFDSCAAIAIRLNYIDRSSLKALYERASYFFDVGDYHRSIDYAARCESLSLEYAAKNKDLEKGAGEEFASSSFGWHVNGLLKLKRYGEAEELLRDKIEKYSKAGLSNYLGMVYAQLASVQEQKGNYERALFCYNQSVRFFQEAKDSFNCKQTLKDIGHNIFYQHFKDGDRALTYYKKALKYATRDKEWYQEDKFESLNIFSNMAKVYVQKGLYDSASRYFQLAFDQVRPGINEETILHSSLDEFRKNKKVYYLTSLVIDKGDAFLKKFKTHKQPEALKYAEATYKVADLLLDRVKAEQSDLHSKLFWRSDSRRLYENAIEACYLQGNTADAFYFFEKSRASLLNDQLNEQRWMGESNIQQQNQLKKKILRLERETNTSNGNNNALKAELFSAKQELDRLGQMIRKNNPLYYQNFVDTSFITIQQVQLDLLKDHHALLEIFSGDSAVYALLITATASQLAKINKQDFETNAEKFISYLSNPNLLNMDFGGFTKTSSLLHQLIFRDLPVPGNRLIISPDGQYFPFEALVSGNRSQPVKWFLYDHAVSYTYSARFLMNEFIPGSARNAKNFLGFAPVNYAAAFSLAALPGSEQSLTRISGYFNNPVNHVTGDASRKKFLQQFGQYRIIQLYTHADDSSTNNEPVIYFADSALYLSDLINEKRPVTRLVVLSACETGTGKVYNGEGVFSFNRGFAALGIPAAITNLWSVDNGSTYTLTELFYKWLASGLPTDVALQKAKLEFLQNASREKSLPCFWAGPVLVGKTDIIELSKPYPWKWIAVLLGVGTIGFFVIRKRSHSKRTA